MARTIGVFLFFFGFICMIALNLYSDASERSSKHSEGAIWSDSARKEYPLHPAILDSMPDIPSPCRSAGGLEAVTILTEKKEYVLVPVAFTPGESSPPWNQPLQVDGEDFPTLGRCGLHSEIELDMTRRITGRSIAEITELGRPDRLSTDGFLCEDEDILSVLKGDNRLVKRMGLTHFELAAPLIHLCGMIQHFREAGVWSSPYHSLTAPGHVLYNGKKLQLKITFTKGGQESIFNDGLNGAWGIEIWRQFEPAELDFVHQKYSHLDETEINALVEGLSHLFIGEMAPFYIYRYGFYEGHTGWRADPITIASLFGLRTLEQIESAFPKQTHEVLSRHHASER
ncbi:MAG: hypothetical protein JXR73_10905 [Candidatus Omnitrophica bacterium]|nr:hypothetical protein [Candidatus Omnitrophota bacterium]